MNTNEKKEITIKTDYMAEFTNTQQLCALLLKTPHYAKMGSEGIFAIVETAKSLGVDPRQALSGGLYYVKGKVEMSSRMMNALIRANKHSITRDKRSDENICILHGKRADNGDTWTESFSIEDAVRAGLAGSNVWKTYPKDMLFARALSRLARQLFPDIIGNCYVEGEIALDDSIPVVTFEDSGIPSTGIETLEIAPTLSNEQYSFMMSLLDQLPDYKETIMDFIHKKGFQNPACIPFEMYEKILHKAQSKLSTDTEGL